MLELLLEWIMEGDTTVGFLVIIAFLLGAGVQKLSGPNGNQLHSVLRLVEALASHLGAEHIERKKDVPPPSQDADP